MDEKYFIADILDEDLDVMEKWLIKVSVLDSAETSEDGEEMVSRNMVFELIAKIADDYEEALKFGYEVSKLPTLYLTDRQKKLLKLNGRFELFVGKRGRYA